MSEDPPQPPTERSCERACLRGLLCCPLKLEKNTFPLCCPSWKLLFDDLVCSLALRLMIHFILSRRPDSVTANFPVIRTRRPRHFATPPLGLIDLVPSSSAPPASAALLLSTSVGRHSARQRTEPLFLLPSSLTTLKGQVLVDVLAAYSDFPFSGNISIFDGRASNYIYTREDWDWDSDADFGARKKKWLTRHPDSSEFKNELRLTGPGRAISAFCGFSISASIPETDEYYTTCYDRPCWDDKGNTVDTMTITTSRGSLHVTCAVLGDAVRADLKVMVRLPWVYGFAMVHGRVTAYIDTFEVGATLFSRDVDELEDVPFTDTQEGRGSIGSEFCLPLDRDPLVVPIGSCLHIKGELVLNRAETISIDHSIPTESRFFETGWPEDNDLEIHTAVSLTLSYVWV